MSYQVRKDERARYYWAEVDGAGKVVREEQGVRHGGLLGALHAAHEAAGGSAGVVQYVGREYER